MSGRKHVEVDDIDLLPVSSSLLRTVTTELVGRSAVPATLPRRTATGRRNHESRRDERGIGCGVTRDGTTVPTSGEITCTRPGKCSSRGPDFIVTPLRGGQGHSVTTAHTVGPSVGVPGDAGSSDALRHRPQTAEPSRSTCSSRVADSRDSSMRWRRRGSRAETRTQPEGLRRPNYSLRRRTGED